MTDDDLDDGTVPFLLVAWGRPPRRESVVLTPFVRRLPAGMRADDAMHDSCVRFARRAVALGLHPLALADRWDGDRRSAEVDAWLDAQGLDTDELLRMVKWVMDGNGPAGHPLLPLFECRLHGVRFDPAPNGRGFLYRTTDRHGADAGTRFTVGTTPVNEGIRR